MSTASFKEKLAQLGKLKGGSGAAARAAGFHPNNFSKYINGTQTPSEETIANVDAALKGSSVEARPSPRRDGQQNAPAVVLELLAFFNGSITSAAEAAAINKSSLGKIARGQLKLTQAMEQRIRVALGQANALPPPPAKLPGRVTGIRNKVHNDSPLVKELLAKHNFKRSRASAAMGYATNFIMDGWADGSRPFDEVAEARVRAALEGKPPPGTVEEDEFDEYKKGLLIFQTRSGDFESLYEAAGALDGSCLFKSSMGTTWVAIFEIDPDKARTFKKIFRNTAIRITCP